MTAAARRVAGLTPAAPPDGRLRLADTYPPTPESSAVVWLSVTPEPAVAGPPQRTDRAWRRAVARAGGGLSAEVHVGGAMRRRAGAAWWDR